MGSEAAKCTSTARETMADPRGGGLRDRMVKEVIPRDEPAFSFDVAVAVAALTLLTLGLLPLVKDDESGDKTN